MKIYISGPVTGNPKAVELFGKAEQYFIKLGYKVVNPLRINSEDTDWKTAMRNDIRALMDCDSIVMLPGWERSPGAVIERTIALWLEIEVRYYTDDTDKLDVIKNSIYKYFRTDAEDGLNRSHKMAEIRYVIYYFARKYTNLSLRNIGERVGGKDHTTVLYGVNLVDDRMRIYPAYKEKIKRLDGIIAQAIIAYESNRKNNERPA